MEFCEMKVTSINLKQIANVSFKKQRNEITDTSLDQDQKQVISQNAKLKSKELKTTDTQFNKQESKVEQFRANFEGRPVKDLSAGQGLNQIPKQVQAFDQNTEANNKSTDTSVTLNSLSKTEAQTKGVTLTSSLDTAKSDDQTIVEEQRAKELKKEELKKSPLLENQIRKNFPRDLKQIKEDLSQDAQAKAEDQTKIEAQKNEEQKVENIEKRQEKEENLQEDLKEQGIEEERKKEIVQKDRDRLDKIKREEIKVRQSKEEQEKIRQEEEREQERRSKVEKESEIPKTLKAALDQYSPIQKAAKTSSANEDR